MSKQISIATITILLMCGCTPQVAEWSPAESQRKNKVERSYNEYSVTYPLNSKTMPQFTKDELTGLAKNNLASTNSVRVILIEFGGHDQKRMDETYKFFRKWGVSKDNIVVDQESDSTRLGSGILVGIEKFSVVTPACPEWDRALGDSQGHIGMHNMGCAQAVNFGMMVADPRDLVTGKDAELYDGTRHALDVEMYRTDKVKELKYESTSSSSSQGQGSSGGTN